MVELLTDPLCPLGQLSLWNDITVDHRPLEPHLDAIGVAVDIWPIGKAMRSIEREAFEYPHLVNERASGNSDKFVSL